MSATVIFNPTHKTLPVSNLFVTRQPVLDRNQNLVAYEILIRNASEDALHAMSDFAETALVLTHFVELGLEKVLGDAQAFIKVDADVLMSDVVSALPHEKIILEIAGGTEATSQILARLAELEEIGFRFCLDDLSTDEQINARQFLPHVEFIRFDLEGMSLETVANFLAQFNSSGKKLLANKVDTVEQFAFCLKHGFDLFQGYFFAKPKMVVGKKLSPSQISVMQLMGLITTDADSAAIELGLKRDVTLGLNLLRLVNTPSVGSHRIDSLKQALMILGRNQLQRWLQIMLYAEPNKHGQNLKPLLMLATTRGKLMELMAYKHKAGNAGVADTAFMVGIMSLMDTLFGLPMADVLQETAVVDDVHDALLYGKGYYGELLKLVEDFEQLENVDELLTSIKKFRMTSEELYMMQLIAFGWSDTISHVVP